MKAISVWQPYATLIILGHKMIETRGYAVPKSILGQRIAIASTKNIVKAQRKAIEDEEFARQYRLAGLPPLDQLPHGCVLGTVVVHSCAPIDSQFSEALSAKERAFGWYEVGRHAWILRDPRALAEPVAAKGAQGIWVWSDENYSKRMEEGSRTNYY